MKVFCKSVTEKVEPHGIVEIVEFLTTEECVSQKDEDLLEFETSTMVLVIQPNSRMKGIYKVGSYYQYSLSSTFPESRRDGVEEIINRGSKKQNIDIN